MNRQDIFITGAARTPIGRFQGGLSHLSAAELGSIAIKETMNRSGVDPSSIHEVIMGHVLSAGVGQGPGRQAALGAGLSDLISAMTVNKVCGSGLKAVMLAANAICAGEADVYIAGGMESMSNAPYLLSDIRQGLRYGHKKMEDSIVKDGLHCSFANWSMGNAAEFIAEQFALSREELDTFALDSHKKAAAATALGQLGMELIPINGQEGKGKVSVFDKDEGIRAVYTDNGYTLSTNLEKLAALPSVFQKDGRVTAGNAPGLNDGAASLLLMSHEELERQHCQPLARIIDYLQVAVPPKWIFAAPARAIDRLLERLEWSMEDVDLIELNEAFAAQALANAKELIEKNHAWDWDKVNVNGGAIALGHPLGASGARILVSLLYALKARGLKRGIASLCLGGGEAVAMAIELV